jgi:hypothetical protein
MTVVFKRGKLRRDKNCWLDVEEMEIVKEIKYVFRCGVRQYRKMEQRKEIGINNGENSCKLYK